jgi:outer membrane receptor protein involved in Fe transport
MGKFTLSTLFLIAFIGLPGLVFSQQKLKISGTVSDSTKAMALVTVRLLKEKDPTPLQATLTNEKGQYELNKPEPGNYFLTITHTGFEAKQVPLTITSDTTNMVVDPVQIARATGTLTEVVVKSQRPIIEQSDDKIVFNVEDDPSSRSETAIDILRKTPFISVDGEDNIKVNGKSNFKVLLNGRETSMFARNVKEALRGFPGTLISKIEVITAPSAKYDGEGVGGVINIITKKKIVGYNGTLSTFSRTSDKINSFSVNGNMKTGKIGVTAFFNGGIADPVRQYNTSITTPTTPTIYSKRTLDGAQYNNFGWSFGNIEVSFEADSLNTISLYGNIDSWSNRTVSTQAIITDFASSPSTVSNYWLSNKSNNPGYNIGSDYIRKFKKNKDREFSLRFLGEFGKSEAELTSFQDNPGTDRFLINNSYSLNNQYTIQADNRLPLSKNGTLEGGLKGIFRVASSDFQSLVKYNEQAAYDKNPDNTDYFKYRQNVVSLYSMYTLRIKKSSLRVGARVEYTNVKGDFTKSNTEVKSDYYTLLPNVQFSSRVTDVTTLVFAYTKRLQRPYIWDLNPFVNNNDSLNISYGNPDLGPQTSHVFTTSVRFNKGNTFAGINIEGSYSGNKILQYSAFDPSTGVTKTTSLNIGKEYQAALNINVNTKITPKWSWWTNGSVRFIRVTNNSDASQANSGLGGNMNIGTTYKFSDRFNIASYLGLWRDPQTIQTTYPFMTWHNVALNYKVFKNKVNISLRAVNYFEKTRDTKTITKDKNFYNTNVLTQNRRAAVLSLTWNFGKLTENVSKKKGVSNDDIQRQSAPSGN